MIWLVHGTWGRGWPAPWRDRAPWASDDAALPKHLKDALGGDVRLEIFNWSGRNGVRARARATEELQKRLREAGAGVPQFLIGHSHGGTISAYTLRDPAVWNAVDGVVCLSTPFLEGRPRDLGDVAAALVVFAMFASLGLAMFLAVSGTLGTIGSAVVSAVSAVTLIACGLFFYRHGSARVRSALDQLKIPAIPQPKLLILRMAGGDEASAALAFSQAGAALIGRIWGFLTTRTQLIQKRVEAWASRHRRLRRGALTVIVAIFLLSITGIVPDSFREAPLIVKVFSVLASLIALPLLLPELFMFLIMAFLGGLGIAIALVLVVVLVLPFGPGLAIPSLLLDVSAEPCPAGAYTVHQIAAEQGAAGGLLVHSRIYDNPEALGIIAAWIRERLAGHRS